MKKCIKDMNRSDGSILFMDYAPPSRPIPGGGHTPKIMVVKDERRSYD